jgi:hypothetical protein
MDWLRELIGVPEREYTRFEAALGESSHLPPGELIGLLTQRLDALDASVAEQQGMLDAMTGRVPRLFLIEGEYHLALRQAEAEWVRGLLKELTDGTFPDLDAWRHYHETGEFPANLTPQVPQEGAG